MKHKALALSLLATLAFGSCSSNKPPPPPPPLSVIVSDAKVQSIPKYLQYVGHVEAFATVNIVPQVQGVLMGSYFNPGDIIEEGALLFTIDDRPFTASLKQSEALLAQAQANLTNLYMKGTWRLDYIRLLFRRIET